MVILQVPYVMYCAFPALLAAQKHVVCERCSQVISVPSNYFLLLCKGGVFMMQRLSGPFLGLGRCVLSGRGARVGLVRRIAS